MLIGGGVKVYVARERCDLRKSYTGLSLLVQDVLNLDPLSGHLFVFFNKARDKVKVLYWDRNGFCLWQKRLEEGRFPVRSFEELCWTLSLQAFQMLLEGVDFKKLPQVKDYSTYTCG